MIQWFQLALVTFLDVGHFECVWHLTVKEDVWIHNITVPTFSTVGRLCDLYVFIFSVCENASVNFSVCHPFYLPNVVKPPKVETNIAKALLICITLLICILFITTCSSLNGGLSQHWCDGWLCSYSCIPSTIIIVCTCEESESKEIFIIHHIALFLIVNFRKNLYDMITSIGQCLLSCA